MIEIAGLIVILVVFGGLALAAKLLFRLLLLPVTIGLFFLKMVFGFLMTLIGGIFLLALVPMALAALPLLILLLVLGILLLPVALLVKAVV